MSYINEDNKYKLFINKIENEKEFTNEIDNIFNIILKDSFKNILNIPKIDFLSNLLNDVKTNLISQYSNKIIENETLENLLLSISDNYEKKYDKYFENLSSQWKKYIYQKDYIRKNEEKLDIFYFKNFTKHCSKTGEYALHRCNKKGKLSKFIIVYKKKNNNNNSIKYLICTNCRKAYFIKAFKNFCEYCNIKYYSTILNSDNKEKLLFKKENNNNLFLATVYPTHCNILFNKKIFCQKCKSKLYINIKTNELICSNEKCNYKNDNPDSLDWICDKCGSNFITRAILYNNIEIIYFENLIKKALILKKLAQPKKTCCISNENISSVQFYHNKKCNGILYLFQENKILFIVCEKCKAINFYKNFIWTCPFCGLYYREKNFGENEEKIIIKYKKRKDNKIVEYYNRNKKNLFEYIKKKKNYKSIDVKDKEDKNDKILETDIKLKKWSKKIKPLKNDISQKQYLLYSNEKNNNLEQKKISTDYSTSFLETNNEYNNHRSGSQNKRSGLCCKILNRFIRPLDEKAWNSVDKRHVINNRETVQNSDIKINRENKDKLNLKINLISNFVNCISTRREYKDDNEDKIIVNKLNVEKNNKKRDEISPRGEAISPRGEIESPREKAKSPRNEFQNDNNENNIKNKFQSDNITIIKNKILPIKEISNNKKIEKENKENKEKAKLEIKKHLFKNNKKFKYDQYPDNSKIGLANNISTSKFNNINNTEKKEKEKKENLNYSISTKIDVTTIKNSEKDKKINENPFTNKKTENNLDDIYYLNNNLASQEKQKYSAILIKEKEKKNNNNEKNEYNKDKNIASERKIIGKKNIFNKIKKEKIEKINKKEIKKIENNNLINGGAKEKISENSNIQKMDIKKTNWRIKKIYENQLYNGINSKDNKIKNEDNKKGEEMLINKNNKYNNEENKNDVINNQQNDNINNNDNEKKENSSIKEENKNVSEEEDLLETTLSNAIKIDDEKIKQNKKLYENIKMRLISLISRSKLPLFDIDNFLIWQKIGNGSNGDIFQVTSNKTNKEYAVKIIKEEALTSLEYIIKEFEIIFENKHKNIVNLYGICLRCVNKKLFILYILMDLGIKDWEEEIYERKKEQNYYTEKELIIILKQLINVLYYLQKEKCISHRDIKLENILIFKNNVFKLCDFGEAKQKVERNVRKTLRGTDCYMSPLLYDGLIHKENYVQHNPYKSDVFSLGFCFIIAASLNYEIIKEIRKFDKEEKIKEIIIENFNGRYSDDFIYVIMKMITLDEKNRPDFVDLSRIVQNYYFDIK